MSPPQVSYLWFETAACLWVWLPPPTLPGGDTRRHLLLPKLLSPSVLLMIPALHDSCLAGVFSTCDEQPVVRLSWAAQRNTWLLIKLTPKGIVFSILSCVTLLASPGQRVLHAKGAPAVPQPWAASSSMPKCIVVSSLS